MIPECVRGRMFGTEGKGALGFGGGDVMFAVAAKAAGSWSNGISRTRVAPLLGCFVQIPLGTGEAVQIQPQSQLQLYRHNCSLNANCNTNCTLNLNLNPTSNDIDGINHTTLRQNSLPHPRSRNSTRNPDPDRSFCFLCPRLSRPKLPLRSKLRRCSRVKRGNMVKVNNIIIINPQAVPHQDSSVEVGAGAGAVDRCRVNGRMCRRNSRLGRKVKRKCKANWEFEYNRKHTKLMHKLKHGCRYGHNLSFESQFQPQQPQSQIQAKTILYIRRPGV
ncbi:hypothetical protein BU17DRAFT_68063 [Hysterangium stoloniferum]|nr:hypothetical protein BU17DRAFT_68063 [Hysterangium stoloniferum]